MLYRYQIRFRGAKPPATDGRSRFRVPTFCEITMIPTRLGRFFGCHVRRGLARRAQSGEDDDGNTSWHWWWVNTDRFVGYRIERQIEAAPIETIEDMPIELLLEEGRPE